jgi:Tol biopolymer transport system component
MRHAGAWVAGAALVALVGGATPLQAQGYFGQNQVQYDRFRWKVIETEHFLVHYYPEERVAAMDAARMAERAYARLSRVLGHVFREKKPIVLFASRTDFGQNNITGDLGEGTGGVTDALRQRNILPLTGDYGSFEHVLAHEMVHQFQYDIFARGKAGNGLQNLAQNTPPLWFAEGMAEYLSLGPDHRLTDTWVRDAAINGNLPSIEQMTLRPDKYFPYRYGEALWEYVGHRWGDEIIGEIMNAVPNIGVERAFKRELGLSLEELSDEWRETMQTEHLPQVAQLERARKFAQPLLSERRSGGQIFLAPALSNDGNHIAFLSNGSFLRGEVFIDLWLGDARTGKRIKRLVKSTTNADFEELRFLYSQSSFSPDGRYLAFTGQRQGKDVLYLLDVKRRKTVRRFDLPLESVLSPTWSPDGQRIVFSGNVGGITDLYMVDANGKNFRHLTKDRHGDMQPSWSPDGKTIAWASDRGETTDFDVLRFSKWRICLMDLQSGRITVLPDQDGLNLNPQWSPDSRSIAYVSDRTGIQNAFLYDLAARDHYQLTNVIGGVLAATEYSPVISWAHQADRLAFSYYENGDYTVWSVDNPRLLKKTPYRAPEKTPQPSVVASTSGAAAAPQAATARPVTSAPTPSLAAAGSGVPAPRAAGAGGTAPRPAGPGASPDSALLPPPGGGAGSTFVVRGTDSIPADSAPPGKAPLFPASDSAAAQQRSFYRAPDGLRVSHELPATPQNDTSVISVAALLENAQLALPDTTRFKNTNYKVRFQPEYVARPSVGYAQDNFGRGVFGGTTIVLSDLLGNNRLAFAGQVNGRVSEAQLFAGYTNLGGRFQYSTAISQVPFYILSDQRWDQVNSEEQTDITRYIMRQVYFVGLRPRNRFTRYELGAQFNNIDLATLTFTRRIGCGGACAEPYRVSDPENLPSFNYFAPFAAYVSDNTLFGYTGPIMGRRFRFQVEPTIGSFRWIEYLADYRRYDPILFNFLTVATRATSLVRVGRDEMRLPQYIGNANSLLWLRGYDRSNAFSSACNPYAAGFGCTATELVGSRAFVASTELRFPLVRRFDLGLLPISLPPLDGLVFAEAGAAWSGGQSFNFRRPPEGYDQMKSRYVLRSYGAGLRLNLFGFALVRWDYAIPLDRPVRKGFWTWSLGPSF